ncbi:MAG: GntR family transcriptional regulator [Enterocloster bolteae]
MRRKLPPEEELARQLAVSRITIRKALTDLEQEGCFCAFTAGEHL